MKHLIDDMKYFFRCEFLTPADFFHINWKTVKKNTKTIPMKVIIALSIEVLVGTFLMIQYYLTLPFRLLNEIAEWWA